MSWFRKKDNRIESVPAEERRVKTEGLFEKCPSCDAALYKRELEESWQVCPHCSHHFRIGARQRLAMLYDEGKFDELDSEVVSGDPLNFTDTKPYKDRLEQARRKTGLPEAVINARGTMGGHAVLISAMDFQFLGGSMGVAVGEKITRTIERALKEGAAVVVVSMSGGARMQEGTLSLMQMAKISAALARLDAARLPFVSVLTDPTTGGVTASFAMLGDINVAEPKALIGFAGPRVIEQTIRQKLPKDFQTAEFLVEHGMLDAVIDRRNLRDFIISSLDFMFNPSLRAQTPFKAGLPAENGSRATAPPAAEQRDESSPTRPAPSPEPNKQSD